MDISTKYDIGESVRFLLDGEELTGVITSAFIHVVPDSCSASYGIRVGAGQQVVSEKRIIDEGIYES